MAPGSSALALVLLSTIVVAPTVVAQQLNGFGLEGASVPIDEILRGGPPRDGIPALTHPAMLGAGDAPWHDDEVVVGVELGGEARAYPLAILNWHELVNDTVGARPILVSYCPLCGTALVFDRRVAGSERTFGVSGLLYRSDLLLYDRETESLWSQIASRAVSGAANGSRLVVLRSVMTRWGAWKARHPDTRVLGLDTGHDRDYRRSPYGDYARSTDVFFPIPLDRRFHPKMPTIGIRLPDGPARAYTGAELVRAGGLVREAFEGREIVISYDPDRQLFEVEAPPELEVIEGYWFAWAAFHPETSVFRAVSGDAGADPEH